jgi:hypothetical protein
VTAESVLALLRSFFNDATVIAALPAAVCLFIDSLLTNGVELADAIRFTLDAFPAVKSHPLITLALQYTNVAVPFLESALAPVRAIASSMPPEIIQGLKGSVLMFAPMVLPLVAQALNNKVDATLINRAWALVKDWAKEPPTPSRSTNSSRSSCPSCAAAPVPATVRVLRRRALEREHAPFLDSADSVDSVVSASRA